MALLPIRLPEIQNWSCHNCGGCCRQHAIEITEEERQRIIGQGWGGQPGFGPEQPLFAWHSGPPWRKRYQLAHRADGGCVFLDEQGLCKIHGQFGEAAKPLACRIYPYAIHPAGKEVTVSLRFSCPSVVANQGTPLGKSLQDLQTIQRLVVPEGAEKTPPPLVSPRQKLNWKDFLKLTAALDATLSQQRKPLFQKVHEALYWVNLVGQANFDKIQGPRLDEFLGIITAAAEAEIAASDLSSQPPGRLTPPQFRLLVAQYARKDTTVEVRQGWRGRVRLLRAATRFARGKGLIPPLQEGFREVPFDVVEQPFGPWPDGVEELLTRFLRVKVQGLHFCGPAYYDVPFAEGFQSLALMLPAIFWLARWKAASEGRLPRAGQGASSALLTLNDVSQALAIADHHHGYSPIFGQTGFRQRVRMFAKLGEISRLCEWYGRTG